MLPVIVVGPFAINRDLPPPWPWTTPLTNLHPQGAVMLAGRGEGIDSTVEGTVEGLTDTGVDGSTEPNVAAIGGNVEPPMGDTVEPATGAIVVGETGGIAKESPEKSEACEMGGETVCCTVVCFLHEGAHGLAVASVTPVALVGCVGVQRAPRQSRVDASSDTCALCGLCAGEDRDT